jgi:hypothetical protein
MSDGLLPVRFANLFQPQKRCWVRGLSVYCLLLKLWSFDCDPIQLQKFLVCSISVDCIPVDSIPVDSIPVDSIPVDCIPVDSIPVDCIRVDFDSFAHDVSLTRLGPSGDEAE